MELCNVCEKHIETANMQSHVLGKKHLKAAENQERNNRTIIVEVPKRISEAQIYAYFAQHGAIKYHKVTKAGVIFEFAEKEVAEFLINNPVDMNGIKLKIKKTDLLVRAGDTPKKERLKEMGSVEYNSAISYDKIEKIINQDSSFDSQFLALQNAVLVSNEELDVRYDIVSHQLNIIFHCIFPRCKTYKFGSTQMGLGFKECDLDIFMDTGRPLCDSTKSAGGWTTNKIFGKMKSVIYRLRHIFGEVVWIRNARVPIIKFRFIPTNVLCDLSFKNSLGVHKTELLKFCQSLDKRVTPLMILIKYWGRHFKLTTNGDLRNYVLTLMVIFFLQRPSINILPSIKDLQKGCCEQWVDGYQVNFNTTYKKQTKTNTISIPKLLYNFFLFYSTFDFQSQVICPLDGVAHPRTIFAERKAAAACIRRNNEYIRENPDVPGIMINNSQMCIQDPIEVTHIIAIRLSVHKLQNFLAFCEVGAQVCATAAKKDNKYLLSNLFITIPPKVVSKGQILVKIVLSPTTEESNKILLFAYQCVKSALEELFKLQIEIIIHSEAIDKKVLRCTGSFSGAVPGGNNEENSELKFICSFTMHGFPTEFGVVFTNQKPCHETFTKFVKFLNVKMSPIVHKKMRDTFPSQN